MYYDRLKYSSGTIDFGRYGMRQSVMTGNEHDALSALVGNLRLLSDDGSSRIVYDGGDVVYKVQRSYPRAYSTNQSEFIKVRGFLSSNTLPENVRVPNVSLYWPLGKPVIAMERIYGEATGECYCYRDCTCGGMPGELLNELSELGFIDNSWGNIIKTNEAYYLIDVAE